MIQFDSRSACAALLVLAVGIRAEASEPSVTVFAASDQVYRGTTETLGRPTLGVAGEWSLRDELFVGVRAQQARDHDATPMPRQTAASLLVGTSLPLGPRHVFSAAVTQQLFPGAEGRWDYTELTVDIAAREGFGASLSWSPDYYNRGAAALMGEVDYRRFVLPRSYAFVAAGVVRFAGSARPGHLHARLGLGQSWRSFNAELEAFWNSEGRDVRLAGERFSNPGVRLLLAWQVY